MKATLFVLVAISLLCCTPTRAQTPSAKLTVSSSSVDFGDHDIGTATPADNPLTLRNDTDAAVTLSVTSSGPNSTGRNWSVCTNGRKHVKTYRGPGWEPLPFVMC